MTYEELVENVKIFSTWDVKGSSSLQPSDGRRFLMLPSLPGRIQIISLVYFPAQGIALGRVTLDEVFLPNGEKRIVKNHQWLAKGPDVLEKLPEIGYPLELLEKVFERARTKSTTPTLNHGE